MSAAARALGPDDRDPGLELLYPSLSRPGDGKIFASAMALAIFFHVILLLLNLPQMNTPPAPPDPKEPPIVLNPMPLPPPPIEQPPPREPRRSERFVPIPDPQPDKLEPLREEPIFTDEPPLLADTYDFVPDAVPPPARPQTEPGVPGLAGVTVPRLIPGSKVTPNYPEPARRSRLEGDVVLQAIVRADGTVGSVRVMSCNRPKLGFEEAAIEAVRQWLYDPATQRGVPVDVYFNVFVEFRLH